MTNLYGVAQWSEQKINGEKLDNIKNIVSDNGLKLDDIKTSNSDIETLLTNLRSDIFEPVSNKSLGLDESVANSITLDSYGKSILEIYFKSTTATNFYLYESDDNSYWILRKSWSSVTETPDTDRAFDIGFRYIKLSYDAAGTSGTDTVDLILGVKA